MDTFSSVFVLTRPTGNESLDMVAEQNLDGYKFICRSQKEGFTNCLICAIANPNVELLLYSDLRANFSCFVPSDQYKCKFFYLK